MHEDELHTLLERYRTGQCSAEEKRMIDQWFDQAIQEPLQLSRKKKRRLEREMLTHIQHQVKETPGENRSLFTLSAKWTGIAASVLLLTTLWFLFRLPSPKPKRASSRLFSYQTQAGQRVKLVLPDSSVIWLNSNTAIHYDQAFPGDKREIFLDSGEAFFDVKKQEDKPFIVHTGHLDNQVLGTSFNIQTKDYRNTYHLSVNTGKVQIREASDPGKILGTLNASQRFSYDYESQQADIRLVAPEEMSAWKENIFLLHDASWEHVRDKLETWYGISIKVSLRYSKTEKFTARLEKPSLQETLAALSTINHFSYQIKGKEVTIRR